MPSRDNTHKRDLTGLLKLAFAGQTVGDFMHAWNADIGANPYLRNTAFGRINSSGLTVKQPASKIPYVLGGGLVGRAAASYLGAGPFMKGLAAIGGSMYGNHLYKKNNQIAPGYVYRGV